MDKARWMLVMLLVCAMLSLPAASLADEPEPGDEGPAQVSEAVEDQEEDQEEESAGRPDERGSRGRGRKLGHVKEETLDQDEIRDAESMLEALREAHEQALADGEEALAASLMERIEAQQTALDALLANREEAMAELRQQKRMLEEEKDGIEARKDALEEEMGALESALESAVDEAVLALLREEMTVLRAEHLALKAELKTAIRAMQSLQRSQYSESETADLEAISARLRGRGEFKVLPAENVLVRGREVKFDVPPVIKEGRLLIPLRALSAATGADVSWDEETREVTIGYNGSVIVLSLDARTLTVDGKERTLDVPATLVENRTLVPVRFIVENLQLGVQWDAQTETAEIIPDEQTEAEVTDDDALASGEASSDDPAASDEEEDSDGGEDPLA